jgi:pimeloyl-ACP methyl ester carboxylesterase
VGLWGTSFSGGHVIAAAARNGRVKAVVAQVPFVDGRASLKGQNLPYMLQAVGHGLRDLVRQILDRTPHYVPVVAKPGQFALLNKEDALDGYLALVPQGSRWRNECAARVLLEIPRFRPILSAPMVAAPVLLVAAEQDAYIPIAHVVRLADQLPQAELVRLPVGHFDVYTGEWLEQTLALETDFFVKWLRG